MSKKKDLKKQYKALWETEVSKCSKCGKCRSFCPVFMQTRDEKLGTRGRISLAGALISNQIDLSPEVLKSMSTCMRCLRCSSECPSKVDFDKLIRGVRGMLGKEVPCYKVKKHTIGFVLKNRWVLDLMMRIGYFLQKARPNASIQWIKKIPFFYRGLATSPVISKRSALQLYAGKHTVKNPRYRVMLFVGCVVNYLYPEVIRATIDVLNHYGVDVLISKNELCCGIPAISDGDEETATYLAKNNISAIKDDTVDYIVSTCGTCTGTFVRDYEELAGDNAKEYARRCVDITYFLSDILHVEVPKINLKTTYHDPCHLKYGLNISSQPRDLLKMSSEYCEMENADKCCGMAGTFGIMNAAVSKDIFKEKADAVQKSKAEVVVTACPSCVMQLKGQLADYGINCEVIHIIQLLQRSIEQDGNKSNS
ncbi:MAG: (Fe-S)-binding protein [Candidatus Ancaeobacter aquaticus]|nr:(Fe-S)-binding protein [Candidatus Ancaeobacter aquaticus]